MKKRILLAFTLILFLCISLISCANSTTPNDEDSAGGNDENSNSPTSSGYTVALDLTKEWDKVSDTELVQGCLIVNKKFAESHTNELASFLSDYKNSIDFIKNEENINTAAQMVVNAGILPNVNVAKQAIPRSNIAYMDGAAMKAAAQGFYNALSLNSPDDAFYYANTGDKSLASAENQIRVGYFSGTTGIGMAKMISDADSKYTFTQYDGPTTIIPAIVKGDVDIAALPTNAAPNVYTQSNQGVQMLAINTLGVLYVCTNGTSVSSLSDLAGKTIYVPEQAPKLVLQYILERAGVEAEISMEYNLDTLPNVIAQGIVTIAVLPEPKVTVAGNLYAAAQNAN